MNSYTHTFIHVGIGKYQGDLVCRGSIPTKMGAHHFTHRHIDVESTLRGIRSTNMEGPSFHQEPIKRDVYTQDVFENHLKNSISVPPYILHHKNERTGFHNI